MKTVVLLIAHEGYQALEYGITKQVLTQNGIKVITASDQLGTATAHDGSTTKVDILLDKIDPQKIDGLFLIGGAGALTWLDKKPVYSLLQEVMVLERPFGSICISARILAKAGVLGNKRATGWDGDKKLSGIFEEHAVIYVPEPVVVDGHIVTATDPKAAQWFGENIVKVLGS